MLAGKRQNWHRVTRVHALRQWGGRAALALMPRPLLLPGPLSLSLSLLALLALETVQSSSEQGLSVLKRSKRC
jgi:hypothetical protein